MVVVLLPSGLLLAHEVLPSAGNRTTVCHSSSISTPGRSFPLWESRRVVSKPGPHPGSRNFAPRPDSRRRERPPGDLGTPLFLSDKFQPCMLAIPFFLSGKPQPCMLPPPPSFVSCKLQPYMSLPPPPGLWP